MSNQNAQNDEAEHIASALGFEGTVVKTGYLVKRAKKSGVNWKKRYFVLNGSSLVYYETHKKMDDAKGDLLLTIDCVVRDVSEPKYPHCFEIQSAFETLRVACESAQEALDWKAQINQTVSVVDSTTRGFLNLQVKGVFGKSFPRKFFVLHCSALTYHQDHYSTYKKQGEFKLDASTRLEKIGPFGGETELELSTGERKMCVTSKTPADLDTWFVAVSEAVAKLTSRDDLASKRGQDNDEAVVMDGYLATRVTEKAATWPLRFYALTSSALYQADEENSAEALDVYLFDPTCSVCTTRWQANSFQLVTGKSVLHLYGQSAEETARWETAMRHCIAQSRGLSSDPLLVAARRVRTETYTVTFETKQKLAIVLIKAKEWAVVSSSPHASSQSSSNPFWASEEGVTEGSALTAVNGCSCTLQPYDETIRSLTGWQPPLALTFARAPVKVGWLSKRSRGRRGSTVNWKRRFFVLREHKLTYYSDAPDRKTESALRKDTLELVGAAISLVSKQESGHHFCFKLVSGVAELTMQATTVEDMVDWATTLYHSTALANGGGYLLDAARDAAKKDADELAATRHQRDAHLSQQTQSAEDRSRHSADEATSSDVTAHETAMIAAQIEADAAEARRLQDELSLSDTTAQNSDVLNHLRRNRTRRVESRAETARSPRRGKQDDAAGEACLEELSRPLTDAELGHAFGVVGSKGTLHLNPMNFVNFLRAVGVSDQGTLKFELDLFHTFDVHNAGKLDKLEFTRGFQSYVATHGLDSPHVKEIVSGIRNYQNTGKVEL